MAGIDRKSADLWPEGPVSPKVFPNFFLSHKNKKLTILSKKKLPPPQKMAIFWGGIKFWIFFLGNGRIQPKFFLEGIWGKRIFLEDTWPIGRYIADLIAF